MANLVSNYAFDMSNANLYRLTAGYAGYNFYDNINYQYNGVNYSDVLSYAWNYNGQGRVSFFYGDNITISQNVVTGGIVTTYAEGLSNGSSQTVTPLFAMTGISISANALYQASHTIDNSDDYAVFRQALSGNDTIIGSSYEDTLYGFDGNDTINSGDGNDYIGGARGDDVIIGGNGYDTALYISNYSNYSISYNSSNSTFKIRDIGSGYDGTDTVTGVEYFMFNDRTISADQLISSLSSRDSTAPFLSSFSPSDNSVGVATGANLVLSFSEAVTAGSGNIVITNGADTRIISVLDSSQVSFSGSTVTINPNADLVSGSGYYVTIDNGAIKDTAGNNYAGITGSTAFNFTTAVPPDTTMPTVSSIGYGANDGRLSVGETVTLVVTLSEAVNVTGTPTIALANGGVATYASGTGTNSLTFRYTAAEGQNTPDLITAASNALTGTIRDLAGNSAIASSFNNVNPTGILAVDTSAPTLFSSTPADNMTSVAVGSNLTLNFSETVTAGSGNIYIRSTDGLDVRTIAANNGQVSYSGQTVTINPSTDLLGGKEYYVTIDNGAIKDLAGNAYSGMSSNSQFNFKTAPINFINAISSVSTTTHLTDISIVNGIDQYNRDDKVVLTFDGDVHQGNGMIHFIQSNGLVLENVAAGADLIKVSGNTVTMQGALSILHQGSDYTLTIDTGVFVDKNGNAVGGLASNSSVVISNTDGSNFFIKGPTHLNTISETTTGYSLNSQGQSIGIDNNNGSFDFSVVHNAANDTIYRIYQAAFARAPDKSGFDYWATQASNKNLDSITIANAFTHSQEFQQKFGVNPTNADYVNNLYQNVLGRAPDQGGLNYWIHQADTGRSHEQLLVDFANSSENVQLTGAHTANGYWTI